ncbi:cellulosome anchor protein, partial [Gardnerella vaginalis]
MKNKTLVAKKLALVVAGLSMAAPCFIAGAPAFADSYASVQRSTNVNLAKLYGTTDGVGLIYKHGNVDKNPLGEGKFAFQLYYDMLMASNNTRMASKTGKLDAASEKLLNSIKEEIRRYEYHFHSFTKEDGEDSYLLEKHWKRIDAAKSQEELKKAYKDLAEAMRFSIRNYSAHYGLNNVTNGMQNPKSNSFVDPTPTKSKFGNYDLSYLDNFSPVVSRDDSYPHAPAPASLSDVDPNLKGNLVLDKSIGAEAGMPSYVRIKTRRIYPNADMNKIISDPLLVLSRAYLYKGSVDDFGDAYGEKPVLLTSSSYKDDDILIAKDYSGDPNNDDLAFDVSIPEGCHGLYTLLLVGENGRQLGWTTINVDKEGESVGDISRGAAIAASDDESTPSEDTPEPELVPSDVTPSEDTPSDFDFSPNFDFAPSEDVIPSDFDFTPSFDVTPSEDVTPSDFDFTPNFDVTPSEDTYTPSDFDFTPNFDVTPSEDTPSDFDFSPSFDVTPSEDTYTPSDFDFTPSFDVTPSEDTYTPSDFDFSPSFDEAPSSDSDSNVMPSDFTFDYNFDAVDAR